MKNLDLSIIIISFNTKKLTIECVESIVNTVKKVTYEIIVVDNASKDDSVKELKKLQIKNLKIIENKENYGFSKANNIGIKQSNGRYVLFLNSDTVVYEKTIDGVVQFMDMYQDAGAATCFVRLPNGKLDDAAHRGFPTPWRSFTHFSGITKVFPKNRILTGYSLGYLNFKKIHEIDACAGAFMVVRRKAGEEIRWWDEDFFWYGEDLDFCYKLKEKQWKIYFVPEFEILHYKGASGGIKKTSQNITTADEITRKKAMDARFQAMKIFYGKHYKNKYPFFLNSAVILGINMRWRLTKLLNRL